MLYKINLFMELPAGLSVVGSAVGAGVGIGVVATKSIVRKLIFEFCICIAIQIFDFKIIWIWKS